MLLCDFVVLQNCAALANCKHFSVIHQELVSCDLFSEIS